MFKKLFLAAAFCGAFTFAGLGSASTAEAGGCYRGGGFGGYGGYGGGYRGYAPRSVSFYRGGPAYGYGRGYGGFPPYAYDRGFRGRGVSFSFGY